MGVLRVGVRLNKALGWALTDVATTVVNGCPRLDDPRINADSRLLSYDDEPTVMEYATLLAGMSAKNQAVLDRVPGKGADDASDTAGRSAEQAGPVEATLDVWTVRDALWPTTMLAPDAQRDRMRLEPGRAAVYEAEYGDPNVLLLRPVSCPDWFRREDTLDYAIEATSARAGQNYATVLPHAPYPFSGLFMDAATGARLPDKVMTWVRLQSRLREEPDLDHAVRARIGRAMEIIAVAELGFKDGADAVERIVPCVPGEVRALAQFGDLFTSDDVWLQLRPALYTFWT